MTPLNLGRYRWASLAALVVLLPVNGYVWSQPVGPRMLILSAILMVLGLVTLFFVNYFFAASERESARLSDELEKKSTQVLELVEAEREDDRIIESLTDRINQLKSTLLHNETRHVSGSPQIVFPDAAPSASTGNGAAPVMPSIFEHPKLYSIQEFKLLATQFARVASRYERHFTVIRLKLNVNERAGAVGLQKAADEYRAAIEVIGKTLRTSDFAAIEGSDSIIVGYPETSAIHVDAIMSRLRAALESSEARDLKIELDRRLDRKDEGEAGAQA